MLPNATNATYSLDVADAAAAGRSFMVLRCGHEDNPCAPSECLGDLVGGCVTTCISRPAAEISTIPAITIERAMAG